MIVDHVYAAVWDDVADCSGWNEDEVEEAKFVDLADLVQWMREDPSQFTPWFRYMCEEQIFFKFSDDVEFAFMNEIVSASRIL